MLVLPGEPRESNPIIQIIGFGGALFFGIILWIFTTKGHNKWLTKIEKSEISGVITNKEIREKEFLLNLKTNNLISKDTCISIRSWGKLFDECQINDTLIKKAGSFDIVIKRNNEIHIFTLSPENL